MTVTTHPLADYAATGSEAAFRKLVEEHVGLVYSTALRKVAGDAHLAQDIAQIVFADLARKARELPAGVVLGGWLHRHTCLKAAECIRTLRRRQAREQTAVQMNSSEDPGPEADWSEVAPLLDDAMDQLKPEERDALVLRFFERRDFRAIGAALGISDDAAQKRVTRALDKLYALLAGRGITTTAAALGAALSAQAVTSIPSGLVATLAGAALAGVATTTAGGSLFGSLFPLMATTSFKAGVIALLAVGAATGLFLQHRKLERLREDNADLVERLTQASLPAPAAAVAPEDAIRERVERAELLRLRGEVSRLRAAAGRAAENPAAGALKPAVPRQPVELIGGYELFNELPVSEHHVETIITMKQVGAALRTLAQEAANITAEAQSANGSDGGTPTDVWETQFKQYFPESAWGHFEILAPNVAALSQLQESNPGAVVSRSKESIALPDGRFVRIYGRADGSVLNLIHDSADTALNFGELEEGQSTTPP